MYSPRVLAVLFVALAACAAAPADTELSEKPLRPISVITEDALGDDNTWFSFPLIGNFFAPLWKLFPSFADIGPSIYADDDKFQVVVNVKDYKKDDLKVKVKNGFIFVQGSHEGKQDERDVFASQFFHTYSLPANCSGADVTADLTSDGFLVVTAPLGSPADRSKEADRELTLNETGAPYKPPKDVKTEKEAPSTSSVPAPVAEDQDDRKEPTTERQEAEKENSIPHGNENAAL